MKLLTKPSANMPKLPSNKQKKEKQLKIYLTDSFMAMLESHCKHHKTQKSRFVRQLLITRLIN